MYGKKLTSKGKLPVPALAMIKKFGKQKDNLKHLYWKLKLRIPDPVLERPIFIIGSPRSGTTIGVKLFATHNLVANWSEAGHIWDPEYYDPNIDHFWPKERVNEKDRKRLHSFFEHYRRIQGKERFVNKHPRNSIRVEYINEIFPDAYFIHFIRDGRAVANSALNRIKKSQFRQQYPFGLFVKPPQWRKHSDKDFVEQCAYLWRDVVEYILNVKDMLGDRYIEVKYEDLVMNTKESYANLFETVGLPYQEKYLADIPEQLSNMNYKYQHDLSTDELSRIEAIQANTLRKFGYI